MNNRSKTMQMYQKFCSAEGNQYIASEYAVQKLQELITKFEVKKVLELGLGIGSIVAILLEVNGGLDYTGTEANSFCLESLPVNLGNTYERLKIYPSLKHIPTDKKFDLVIVDGKDPELPSLKKILSNRGIIVLEGDRLEQQKFLQNLYPRHKMVHAISLRKNKSYSPFAAEDWQGGLKIIFTNPSEIQYAWWLKEKFLTRLKYQYPGRHFGSSGFSATENRP